MKKVALIALIGALTTIVSAKESAWNEAYYNRYDYTNYTTYAAFNQRIVESGYDSDLLEAAIFYETNRQRSLHGLKQFKFDYNLYVCAHNHSYDMVEYNFFSHTSVVEGKTTMSDRMKQVGYANRACAENIVYTYIEDTYAESAKSVVDVWMNSPGHRANILNPDYTHLGCGAVFYEKDNFIYYKATQNFLKKTASDL